MSQYIPDDYETVKARKQRFRKDHPDGRIEVELQNGDLLEYACVRAIVFKNAEEQGKRQPLGVGMALELRDKALSTTRAGKEYESVNYTSWLENCEESAVGRALDNAGYASNQKCSRDEMEKAQRNAKAQTTQEVPKSPSTPTPPAARAAAGQPAGWPDSVPVPFGKFEGDPCGTLSTDQIERDVRYWRDREAKEGRAIDGKLLNYIQALEEILHRRTGDDIPF